MATLGIPKYSQSAAAMTVKGGPGSDSRGGSSRSYPKGSPPGNTDSAPFNPQKVAATSKYVGGV